MSASRPAPTAGRRTRPQVSMSCVPCCADEARRICATSNDGERATMEFESVIRGRRSIRAYTNEAVPVDLVREILDEARWAPSWRNTQAWNVWAVSGLSLIHISEPTRLGMISYAVFCLKKKKTKKTK